MYQNHVRHVASVENPFEARAIWEKTPVVEVV
jgi:hypothetical protein